MKRKLFITLIVVLCLTVFVGCSNNKENVEEGKQEILSKEDISRKIFDANNDLTSLWNNVICEVSWYTKYGTSSVGKELDIDFVISHAKEYYDKVVNNKEFIDSLGEEYNSFIDAYDKAVEKATIIYNQIMEEKPVANQKASYNSDMELFNQYQTYFYEKTMELYMNN